MNISRAKLFRPTVNLVSKNPKSLQFAIYGHLIALAGGLIMVLASLFALSQDVIWGIIIMIFGLALLGIELDLIDFPELKDPLIRGVIWVVIGILAVQVTLLGGLVVIASAVLYLLYHFGY